MDLAVRITGTVIRASFALALLVMSAYSCLDTYLTLKKEKQAIVQVSSILPVSNGRGGIKSYPLVSNPLSDRTTPNNTGQPIAISGLFLQERYTPGEYILVRYNPEMPTVMRSDHVVGNGLMWVFPVVTGGLGLLILPRVKDSPSEKIAHPKVRDKLSTLSAKIMNKNDA